MFGLRANAMSFRNRRRRLTAKWLYCTLVLLPGVGAMAQTSMTWGQVVQHFEQNNPTLLAGTLNIDESKAEEITAFLRPIPQFTVSSDGTQVLPTGGGNPWQPFVSTYEQFSFAYLHERAHKRELRLESARKGTAIAVSTQADLKRNLLFGLRSAFVAVLQGKAVLQLAKDDLAYWDHVLDINRIRFQDGAIAKIDFNRLKLQRVQYESDVQTAEVNLRTAKIALLMLLNDRTPIEQFDLSETFDFSARLLPLDHLRQIALDTRPDLRAAVQSLDKSKTDHQLAISNGSTDPVFGVWWSNNPSFNFSPGNVFGRETLGVSVSIPLRIFDRNQGEKLRTEIDISRNEKLRDAAQAQVFNDVDSAYTTLNSNIILLQPYKREYLQTSVDVRDTVYYAYQKGAASLLEFLDAESEYRSVQVAYVNLVGSYLTAAAQLNQAVGHEVIP